MSLIRLLLEPHDLNSRNCLNPTSSATNSTAAVNSGRQFSYRALVIECSGPSLRERHVAPPGENEVVVRVESLGLCRTDLRVYRAEVPFAFPLIPGHEFAGVVEKAGVGVTHVSCGDRVAINPVLSCGDCHFCEEHQCQESRFLGLDLDGACAEFCKVPGSAVYKVPDDMPFEVAAFAEPVAASLAVLNAEIKPDQRGILLGDNRIAVLTQRILQAHDFSNVQMVSANQLSSVPQHVFDFAIETFANTETIQGLVRSVRPGGLVVLKSRQQVPIELNLVELLPKNIRFQCVNYGSFEAAIDLLSTGALDVSDLIGTAFGLGEYAQAFQSAFEDESSKVFIRPQVDKLVHRGGR